MKNSKWFVWLLSGLCASPLLAWPQLNNEGYIDGESIKFDPRSGDYIVTYYGASGNGERLVTLVYETPNKIKPAVKMQIRSTMGRDIAYAYDVSNDRGAKQDIYAFGFSVRSPWWEKPELVTQATAVGQVNAGNLLGAAQAIETRVTYAGSIEATRMKQSSQWLPEVSFAKTNRAFRFNWQAHPNKQPLDDIKPGQHRAGFGLRLPYLPGLVTFGFDGNSKPFGFPGAAGGDSKIWKDIDKLMFGSTAPAPSVKSLGPTVLIPEPFVAQSLATGIRDDLATWVAAGQLSEPLAQRLRSGLDAIGNAAELNNSAGVLGNAEQVFYALFSRHPGMRYEHCENDDEPDKSKADHPELSRLAARAIAFNTFELTKRYFVQQLARR